MRTRPKPNACLLVFSLALAVSATWGAVPSVSAATITTMEYFIDADPGEGLGTPIPVTPNTGIATVKLSGVSVADLSQGSHLIFIRAKDDTGHWGPARQSSFEMPFAGVNVSPVHIDSAEYFFDQDPGPGNGMSIPAPVDGLFDSLQEAVSVSGIDSSSLPLGPHTLSVRMHGSDGIWGPARSASSGVTSQSSFNFEVSGARSIMAMEYFIDTDPGPGNAIPLPLPSVIGSLFRVAEKNISMDSLSLGTHLLYLRAQDGDGGWGPAHQQRFEMITTDQTISAAEYFVDADPGEGNGSLLSPNDGAFDEGAEQVHGTLDASSLADGLHQLYVRARSSNGEWSAAVGKEMTVGGTVPVIESLSPTGGVIGSSVIITGTNFGVTQDSSTVTFNGVNAAVTSWSDTSIEATVPAGATDGPVVVTVNSVASNQDNIFFVLDGTQINFPDFSSTGCVDLVGSASQFTNRLRLTAVSNFQDGAAWCRLKQPIIGGFETTFQFQITSPGGLGPGADGFAFVIQNTSLASLGGAGSAIGYASRDPVTGIANSVAIEFDTYNSNSETGNGDPNDNHIAVQTGGILPNSYFHVSPYVRGITTDVPDMKDGNVHTVRVKYAQGVLSIYIDDLTNAVLTVPLDLATTLNLDNGQAWIGFTAATGNGYENHDILSWLFTPAAPQVAVQGLVVNDATNAPISGATVSGGGRQVKTDTTGHFTLYVPLGQNLFVASKIPSPTDVDQTLYEVGYKTINVQEPMTLTDFRLVPLSNTFGQCLSSSCPKSVEPVNTATGNYYYAHRDLNIPGRGIDVTFIRYYNSQDSYAGPLGPGWTHNWNIFLITDATGSAHVKYADGHEEFYAPDGTGNFVPQAGVHSDLSKNPDDTYSLITKNQTRYDFDTAGLLSRVTDKNGNAINLTRDGSGNLIDIMDTVGRHVTFAYDGAGHLKSLADPLGRMIHYDYDAAGNLISVTDARGNATSFTYDSSHQLLTVTDPRGNTIVQNTYDAASRVVTVQRDAIGSSTAFTYDPAAHQTRITDPLGHVTIHTYDERDRVVSEQDPLGKTILYAYDEDNNRTSVTDKKGNLTSYTYDGRGNRTSTTDPLGQVTTMTYDALNNPLTRTDALGKTTTLAYDATGNLTTMTDPLGCVTHFTHLAYGELGSLTDCLTHTTSYTYDSSGNVIQIQDALGGKTLHSYDAVGRLTSTTDAKGNTTTFAYDDNDNLLSATNPLGQMIAYEYDANNNRTAMIDARGNRTTMAYDPKDRLITITAALGQTFSYSYDALDRRISQTDFRGNLTHFTYDAVGRLTQLTDPLGHVTAYTYDFNGNRTSVIDPLSHTTTMTYDSLNRRLSASDPLGHTTHMTYDALNRVLETTDPKGNKTAFAYDALGRLLQVTEPGGGITHYTYNGVGNRLTMVDSRGQTTTYAYDALNRRISETDPLGNITQSTYDPVGNHASRTDAIGAVTTFTYNAANRLTQIAYSSGPDVTLTYDADGNRLTMVDSLGTTSYSYDAVNRITSITDPQGQTIGYAYDAAGNRTGLTYPGSHQVAYTYDGLNRMSTVTDWLGGVTSYGYDAAGNLIGTTNPNGTTVTYGYDDANRQTSLSNKKADASIISSYLYNPGTIDPNGNPTLLTQNEPLIPLIPTQSVTSTYDADNRLTTATGANYSYDANGNLTQKVDQGVTTNYGYDVENRLTAVSAPGQTAQYAYDGLGHRYRKTENGTETRFIVDTNTPLPTVLAETDSSGTPTAYYVHGLGLIARITPAGVATYYHYNPTGSTVAMTNAAQNITDAYAYDPFGNLTNRSGSSPNPFMFEGQHGLMNEVNGLVYIRARYYSTKIGRFITKDSLTGKVNDSQSLNRYVYALNNPVRLLDISGLSSKEMSGAIGAGDYQFPWWYNWTNDVNPLAFGIDFVVSKSLGAVADYLSAGGGLGLPVNFPVSQYSLPIAPSIRVGQSLSKGAPFIGIAISAIGPTYNYLKDPSVENAARIPLAVSGATIATIAAVAAIPLGPMGSLAVGSAVDVAWESTSDWLYESVIDPVGVGFGGLLYDWGHGNLLGNLLGF